MIQTDDIKMVVTHDRQERQPITTPTRNWRFSGLIKLYASYQAQCWQTVFVSEIANFL